MITTTLMAIRECNPRLQWYEDYSFNNNNLKLKCHLGDQWCDTAPIKFSEIAKCTGIFGGLWCMRTLSGKYAPNVINFSADCIIKMLPLWESWAQENVPDKIYRPRETLRLIQIEGRKTINIHKAVNISYIAVAESHGIAFQKRIDPKAVVANVRKNIAYSVAYAVAGMTYIMNGGTLPCRRIPRVDLGEEKDQICVVKRWFG